MTCLPSKVMTSVYISAVPNLVADAVVDIRTDKMPGWGGKSR